MIQSSLGVSTDALLRISTMDVSAGTITAVIDTIDATVNGKNLVMIPTSLSDGSIRWDWTTTNGMPPAYVPKR
jgi:hypothetical protein